MTTLNTIIEEEKKEFAKLITGTTPDKASVPPQWLEFFTTAMQRAYEAGKAEHTPPLVASEEIPTYETGFREFVSGKSIPWEKPTPPSSNAQEKCERCGLTKSALRQHLSCQMLDIADIQLGFDTKDVRIEPTPPSSNAQENTPELCNCEQPRDEQTIHCQNCEKPTQRRLEDKNKFIAKHTPDTEFDSDKEVVGSDCLCVLGSKKHNPECEYADPTPDTELHMKALAKAECAKDAGELTVVRLGYVVSLMEEVRDARDTYWKERVREIANKLRRTDETQMSEDHIYDEALDDLLDNLK